MHFRRRPHQSRPLWIMQAVCLRTAGLGLGWWGWWGWGWGDFGQFRSVPVFGIHIKYRSWNMLMSYSKQFYMLVSRTGRAILGHQVLCPLTTPTSRKMLQSIADAKSLFSEKLWKCLASSKYRNAQDLPNCSIHTEVRPNEMKYQSNHCRLF